MHINPDKIREVIGKGGSVIQNIVAESGAKVDIEDDGTVTIAAVKATDADKAKKMIEAIVKSDLANLLPQGRSSDELRRIRKPAARQGRHGSHQMAEPPHRSGRGRAVPRKATWFGQGHEIDDKGRVNLSMGR